jgi:hypothetical protein
MKSDSKEQQTMREYLLGQASQEDSSRFEERLLADSVLYEELLIVEDELSDQYLSDELSQAERQSFETYFLLAPERQQKFRFARALYKYVNSAGALEPQETAATGSPFDEAPEVTIAPKRTFFSFLPTVNPIVSYSLMAAMLLIVGGIFWALINNWQRQTTQQSDTVLTVLLTPGLTRDGGELKRVAIRSGTGTVQLQLELPRDEYRSYRAIVLSSDRSEVWNGVNLHADEQDGIKLVAANVPASVLSPGDYQVRLSGQLLSGSFEDIADYRFRIAR